MSLPESLRISGHLNAATCHQVKHILIQNGVTIDIDARPAATSEPFGLDEMTISLAGAIASIVSCVVGILQLREQRQQRERKEHEKAVDNALRQIGDGTYERIQSIQVTDDVALEESEEFAVVLRDVPAARHLVVVVRRLEEIIVIDSSEK